MERFKWYRKLKGGKWCRVSLTRVNFFGLDISGKFWVRHDPKSTPDDMYDEWSG